MTLHFHDHLSRRLFTAERLTEILAATFARRAEKAVVIDHRVAALQREVDAITGAVAGRNSARQNVRDFIPEWSSFRIKQRTLMVLKCHLEKRYLVRT